MSDVPRRQFTVRIDIDPARARHWHLRLARHLSDSGHHVIVAPVSGGAPYPLALTLLTGLERLVLERGRPGPSSPIDFSAFTAWRETRTADVVIDLSARSDGPASELRALYDGHPGEEAAAAALLRGTTPRIAVATDAADLRIAVEDPKRLVRALDQISARLCLALLDAVAAHAAGRPRPRGAVGPTRPAWDMALSATCFVQEIRRTLQRRLAAAPHWYIGWRDANGAPLHETLELPRSGYTIIPDDGRRFYADPVLFRHAGKTALFLEEFPYATEKGLISVIEIGPDGPSPAARPVIERAGHLSYPFVFAREGEVWMIPESSSERKLILYRARDFPLRWEEAAVLLDNIELHDATLHEAEDGMLVLFANVTSDGTSSWDTLTAYTATSLHGPWRPHPANPLLVDALASRPAGRLFRAGGRLIRPAQDCRSHYGAGLAFAEVTRLDAHGFAQDLLGVVAPGPGLPGRGLHAYDLLDGLEVVDGCRDRIS